MRLARVANHENNVPSRLSSQWLCGNSCIWPHDVRLGCMVRMSYCRKEEHLSKFLWTFGQKLGN